ncbi:MAG: HPr family phosphocarrier protein [Chthoniobacteraceae bacterium]|nr:HPr family phosphocarrier protein [Chthoniobacteraceae bacterium]
MNAHTQAVFIVNPFVNNTQATQTTDGLTTVEPYSFQNTHNEKFAGNRKQVRLLNAMLEREVKILNRLGLHARPAAEFVRAVRTFQSSVTIIKNGDDYSGASILDVLSANLDHGSTLVFRIEGPDAEDAMERLCALLEDFRRQEEEDGI